MQKMFETYMNCHRNPMIILELKHSAKSNSFDLKCSNLNHQFEKMFGIVKKNFRNTLCKSFFFDFNNLDSTKIKEAISCGENFSVECLNLKLKKYFRFFLSPVDRKTAICEFEEILLQTNTLKDFGQDTDDLIWTLDNDLNITFASNSLFNLMGVNPDYIIGKNLKTYFENEAIKNFASDINTRANHWKKDLTKITSSVFEIKTNNIDGNEVWLETHFSPIVNNNKKIEGYKGISRNVTRKKEIEHQLLQSQIKYKNLVNMLPEIIFELNLNLRFTFFNKSALDILGYNQKDLEKGIFLEDILSKPDVINIKKRIKRALNSDFNDNKIFTVFKKDQSKIFIAIYYNAIKLKNKVVGIRGIGIDITSKKNIETKLIKAKQKLDEAGKLKSVFLANMSHEIRTPMNSILGYTQLLQKKETEPSKLNFLDTIYVNSKRLLNLLNDIIDISKLEAGDLDILYEKIQISKTLGILKKEFSLEINCLKKDINLIFNLENSNKLNSFICDTFRLKQVIKVLFSNALKFTERGEIEIGCTAWDIKQVLFYVRDTGIGLSKENFESIFNAFEQGNESIAVKYGGSGIGLALARGVISRLHGKIWVESELNKGSKFCFTLPFDPSIYENDQQDDMDSKGLEGKNILIVEDDEDNFIFLHEIVKDFGVNVFHAIDSKKAIELFSHHSIDCVLMDIQLPGTDGYETTRLIKQINESVPIIAQTAYAMPHERKKCFDAGCADYISKPIDSEEMLKKIKNLVLNQSLLLP